jgi:uncharacterized peroxidase-related enzyme
MWIAHVPFASAEGKLKTLYDRVKGPDDNVDNIMLAHSLRPHSMEGHMVLYKNVLHHSANLIPQWFLETLGVYTSQLNRCEYCAEHHYVGLRRLLADDARSAAIRRSLETEAFDPAFTPEHAAALRYARVLTKAPADTNALHAAVRVMRDAGFDDGRILEVNQVVAYFNYANRTVLGLGVTTEGDVLGLSPGESEQPENWSHR